MPLSTALEYAYSAVKTRPGKMHRNLSSARNSLHRTLMEGRLAKLLRQYRANYAAASPFPHTVIDGFLPESFIRELAREMPQQSKLVDDGAARG